MKVVMMGLAGASLALLAACTDDGYGGGVAVGYNGYYNDFYDGAYGTPYYGWYGDYYYPGTGVYVYDRARRPVRWNQGQQRYWQNRAQGWQGTARNDEWRGFDRGPSRGGGDGYRGRGHGRR